MVEERLERMENMISQISTDGRQYEWKTSKN